MTRLEDTVLRHPFFAELETDLGTTVLSCAREVRFEAGAYLFHEDESADAFYLIRDGVVALEFHAPGRPPATFLTLGAGEIAGTSWIAPPYRWAFDARAVRATDAIRIDAHRLRAECEANHDLGYQVMKRLLSALIVRLHAAHLQSLDVYGKSDR